MSKVSSTCVSVSLCFEKGEKTQRRLLRRPKAEGLFYIGYKADIKDGSMSRDYQRWTLDKLRQTKLFKIQHISTHFVLKSIVFHQTLKQEPQVHVSHPMLSLCCTRGLLGLFDLFGPSLPLWSSKRAIHSKKGKLNEGKRQPK